MGGFDERYEVSCSNCGVLGFEGHVDQALAFARSQEQRHQDCGSLEVFDRMAHYGQPEMHRPDGTVKSRKQV